MIKKFTAVVPDKLYFPEISGNTKVSYTYDGPSTINVDISTPSDPVYMPDGVELNETNVIISLNANSNPQAAYLLLPNPITGDKYVFEEETLSDGSKYLNRKNPSLHDYYKISYNADNSSFKYVPLTREWKTHNLSKAETVKSTIETGMLARIEIDNGGNEAVKQFLLSNGIDVEPLAADEVVQQLRDFISVLDAYIIEESKIISWKYENGPPETQFPEIPEIIKKFF